MFHFDPAVIIDLVWSALVFASAVLFVACDLIPHRVVHLQSMPWTFQPSRVTDLSFQAVTYEAFHTSPWSQRAHLLLAPEALAWLVLLGTWHGALPWVAAALLTGQAVRMGEPDFGRLLGGVWWAMTATAAVLLLLFPAVALATAMKAWLVVAALIRTVSHAAEPIPPMLAEETDQFVPLSLGVLSPRFVAVGLAGIVSEFASALPFRLFPVVVYHAALDRGLVPERTPDAVELGHTAQRIHAQGWRAYPEVWRDWPAPSGDLPDADGTGVAA
jgi:hypothetical protein